MLDRRQSFPRHPQAPGANQPYHFAENWASGGSISQAALRFRATCLAAFRDVVRELNGYEVAGAAILLASGRPLLSLPVFWLHTLSYSGRRILPASCAATANDLGICVTGIRERELGDGSALQRECQPGKVVGP